ncbi:hypothetical protein AB0L13_45410 [Saccharopolyspora shandongensis]|uniref:hypothetical protein n=1 Tax=Saccharopolyspora shandongensis TaxID=418495 RepID=UPI0034333962
MGFTFGKREMIVGLLAAGALAGTGGIAAAAPAENVPELRISSAGYALEYTVVNGNGDGFSSVLEPNSTRERQAEGFTTVRFSVNGKVVNAYGPLEAGRTLVCNAGGTAAAPNVECAFA